MEMELLIYTQYTHLRVILSQLENPMAPCRQQNEPNNNKYLQIVYFNTHPWFYTSIIL
jgi:hypothetical protein